MSIDLTHLERSLHTLPEAQAVMAIARQHLSAWPDVQRLARQAAAACLQKHTDQALNPDNVWWHRFDHAASSSRTFTGWQHNGPPAQSIAFTELVIRRFDSGFQVAPDTLDTYSGFYFQGGEARQFDERNEVALLPSAVMVDFWDMDFAHYVTAQREAFWAQHGRDFRLLALTQLVAAAEQGRRDGLLLTTDVALLKRYAGIDPERSLTLGMLRNPEPSASMAVRYYPTGTHGGFYTLQASDGRVLLYTPSARPFMRAFPDSASLVSALAIHLASPQGLAWVSELYHFTPVEALTASPQALADLRERIGTPSQPTWAFGTGALLSGTLLEHLQAAAERSLRSDHQQLVSNASLHKELWRGYLGAYLQVFGAFAPLSWPVGLTVIGAGLARLGLDIQAAQSPSPRQRAAAITAAIGDAILVAFSLLDTGLGLRALRYQAPAHEAQADVAAWQTVVRDEADLGDVTPHSPLRLPAANHQPGLLNGVQVTDRGGTWITLSGQAYRVRYSAGLHCWLVVPPKAPYAFAPLRPVRLDEAGQWQWLGTPGLRGGDLPGPIRVQEPLWDAYMAHNPNASQAMSELALARQQAVYEQADIPSLFPDTALAADEHGYSYLPTAAGRAYTWRSGDS